MVSRASKVGWAGTADKVGTAGRVGTAGTAGTGRIQFKRVINYLMIWVGTSNTVSLSAESLTLVKS